MFASVLHNRERLLSWTFRVALTLPWGCDSARLAFYSLCLVSNALILCEYKQYIEKRPFYPEALCGHLYDQRLRVPSRSAAIRAWRVMLLSRGRRELRELEAEEAMGHHHERTVPWTCPQDPAIPVCNYVCNYGR